MPTYPKLLKALKDQKKSTEQTQLKVFGTLGIPLGGRLVVDVPDRPTFVYVRLRTDQNEVVQAFNNTVASSYGLPVIVQREGNRYIVLGVDTLRYQSTWSNSAPFLPRHGDTHSFNENGGGGDMVWVYSKQFMPLLVYPSGTFGSSNVSISPHLIQNVTGSWMYVGNTGTPNLINYAPPSGSFSVMILVYMDRSTGNPGIIVNSGSYFSNTLTTAAQIAPFIPAVTNPANQIPLGAVRINSGTSLIDWSYIYDIRPFLQPVSTGTASGGGGGGGSSIDNFWTSGTAGAYSVRSKNDTNVNALGDYSFAVGSSNLASGSFSTAEGSSTSAFGDSSHSEGATTKAYNSGDHSEGSATLVNGPGGHAEGINTVVYGRASHGEGELNNVSGSRSFVGGYKNTNQANFAAILGGSGSALIPSAFGSVMLGTLGGYTGTYPNTAYVPKLNVRYVQSGTSVTNLGIDVNGNLVSGSSSGNTPISYPATGTVIAQNNGQTLGSVDTLNFRNNLFISISGTIGEVLLSGSNSTYMRVGQPTSLSNVTGQYWIVPDRIYASGSLSVFNQGHDLIPGIDYVEQYANSGTFQYISTPPTGTYNLSIYGVPATGGGGTSSGGGGGITGAWTPPNTYGWLYPFVKPILANFTWVNQGSGTAIDHGYGGIDLYDNAINTATNYHLLTINITGTYTKTAAFSVNYINVQYMNFGIGWRNSSSGNLDMLQVLYNVGTPVPGFRRLNASSPTVDVADSNFAQVYQVGGLIFLRISDNGTNRKASYSMDGRNFTQIFSVSRTDYITPDQVFIAFQARNGTFDFAGSWLSWE